jgi:nucleolar complex protein 2
MKKATRKFEKNHLKDTLERRKDGAKIKQRNQLKEKKRARRDKDNAVEQLENDGKTGKASKPAEKENGFTDMTVDDFFQGGFEIPKPLPKSGRKKGRADEIIEKSKKRKRGSALEPEDESDSSSDSVEQIAVPSDDESDLGADDDLDVHMGQLDALAKDDPEFYKHLKENDPDLLHFSNFPEVDGLSGSDGEAVPKKSKTKAKKASTSQESAPDEALEGTADDTEVTKATVEKWRMALTEKHSLRAMRQVVLAFRAAAHVNEQDGKQYRYTISSPDGRSTTGPWLIGSLSGADH